MNRWLSRDDVPRGADYDARWERAAAAGSNIHGEADFIASFAPVGVSDGDGARVPSVLDAGCGTGRVGIELARRGFAMVGVDVDPAMLERARAKHPNGDWQLADLATLDLRDPHRGTNDVRRFDIVALPGNVMIFLAAGTEATVLQRLVAHLVPGGVLIAGFQLVAGRLTLARYDEVSAAAGLRLEQRLGTWDGQSFEPGGDYAVSVHRLAEG